jgi:hypothetical protein
MEYNIENGGFGIFILALSFKKTGRKLGQSI